MFWRVFAVFCVLLSPACWADQVQYEFTFDSTWSPETHPGFPTDGHFSGVYGVTHTSDFSFWTNGELASPGIQQIAEFGTNTTAVGEVAAAIAAGTVLTEVGAAGGATSPTIVSSNFTTFATHPLVSLASMIAPSPDWIVGTSSTNLLNDKGNWIPEINIDIHPYDAGTDSGVDFASANLVTDPYVPISRLTETPFENLPKLGTFTYRLISLPGDFNGSGEVDAGDVDVLCYRLGQSHPIFDLTNSDTIELDDVNELIERVIGTRAGDTNLDGDVDFQDFLTLSSNFGLSGNWSAGDSDCDFQIGFEDFLKLSANFGFTNAEAEVASVPEPSTRLGLLFAAMVLPVLRRRRDS